MSIDLPRQIIHTFTCPPANSSAWRRRQEVHGLTTYKHLPRAASYNSCRGPGNVLPVNVTPSYLAGVRPVRVRAVATQVPNACDWNQDHSLSRPYYVSRTTRTAAVPTPSAVRAVSLIVIRSYVSMTKNKTIAKFERERGIMLQGKIDPDKRITADEFDETMQGTTWVGVDHPVREQWLKDNGYDVTRENMADGSLQPQRVKPVERDAA